MINLRTLVGVVGLVVLMAAGTARASCGAWVMWVVSMSNNALAYTPAEGFEDKASCKQAADKMTSSFNEHPVADVNRFATCFPSDFDPTKASTK
jgi:hypothetical protein